MTQTDVHTRLRCFWWPLLLKSLSFIGVLSLLSSNLVLAQTEAPPDVIILPNSENQKPPTAVTKKSATDTPQSAPIPVRRERARLQVSDTPTPARRQRLRQRLSPTPSVPVRRQRLRQEVSTTPRPSVRSVQTRPNKPRAVPKPAADYNGAYIDPTDYNIGATRDYEAPSAVVLSERSTGCQAVLRQGQSVSGSLCGTQRRTRVAVKSNRSTNTAQLPRPQVRNWATTPRSQTPSWVRNTATSVSRISSVRISPVKVSSINVSSAGSRTSTNRRTPVSFQGQIASRSVLYYNRTLPTAEQPGNANTELLFPLTIPAQITSLFGWRIHPITGNRRFHSGTDLGAPLGTPVVAAYEGNVAIADWLGGYGLAVVLDHNKFTQQTLYGHLSEIFVAPGQWVEQGTIIGRVGSTGNSTGPHLHFETRQLTSNGWVATDPGAQLESSLAQLVEALQTAQSAPQTAGTGG